MNGRIRSSKFWIIVVSATALACMLVLGQTLTPPPSSGEAAKSEQRSKALPGEPIPIKTIDELNLKTRSFTFVRVKYTSEGGHSAPNLRWSIDYPGSDQSFSAWFAKKTGLKTDPEGKVMTLTAPQLKEYPFLYMVEPGRLALSRPEAAALRNYLLGGGFLMLDDFWGEKEWTNVVVEFKKVFPNQEPTELPIEHPIFHCYYDIQKKPQVPNVSLGIESQYTGITWERADAKEPHFRGLFDGSERLCVIFCHNTDLGDGWEHEGENEYFSREFSRKKAFPMGINIVLYALTH